MMYSVYSVAKTRDVLKVLDHIKKKRRNTARGAAQAQFTRPENQRPSKSESYKLDCSLLESLILHHSKLL